MCHMSIMDSVTVQDISTVEPCPGERGHGGRGGHGRPARRVAGDGRHVPRCSIVCIRYEFLQ